MGLKCLAHTEVDFLGWFSHSPQAGVGYVLTRMCRILGESMAIKGGVSRSSKLCKFSSTFKQARLTNVFVSLMFDIQNVVLNTRRIVGKGLLQGEHANANLTHEVGKIYFMSKEKCWNPNRLGVTVEGFRGKAPHAPHASHDS